jgi:alkylation response protein AidB-like acyl-CoA dehydrogenase
MSTRQGPVKARGRDAMGFGLAMLNRLARLPVLDQLGLRRPAERVVFQATKTGFRTLGAVTRTFAPARKQAAPARLPAAASSGLFDLTPTDDQQMMVEVVREFAAEQIRPAAAEANDKAEAPKDLLERTAELGLHHIGVPESLGGAGDERSAVTNVLVTEELARGDMGLAVACLTPTAVSTALTLWGDEDQQATYLPAFVSDHIPTATLAILEPRPMFDPFRLQTRARLTPGGIRLDGVKSLVPRAADAELFVIAAELEGSPSLFLVESSTAGLTVEAEPAMGVRAASLSRVVLDDVTLPENALLASGGAYRECVDLSRLAWCALAVGTGQAVLDYVIPYVNQREAFGEPVSHRQSVAFMVADIGIELDGMRLVTYRAASRAAQGKPFARETALAHRLCAERGMVIGSHGVQLLGGHGYVKEHPVERWYRDLRAIAVMEGGVLV